MRPASTFQAKLRGEPAFVHDLACDLHARVVRPPSLHHRLDAIDATIDAPGHLVVNGSFLAVAHPDEYTASRLAERVRAAARWHASDVPAMTGTLADHMRSNETAALPLDDGKPTQRPVRNLPTTHHATYSRPFLMHGSLGPSAAWALWRNDRLLVRSSSQGIELLKPMLAKVLGLEPDQVEVAHSEGAGCYGHNGADDAALDAALVARALPDQAVLLQWSRRRRASFRTAWSGHASGVGGKHRRWRCFPLAPRCTRFHPFRPPRAWATRCGHAGRMASGRTVRALATATGPGPGVRPAPQCPAALRVPESGSRETLLRRFTAQNVLAAEPRRPMQCVRHRVVHG